MLLVVLCVVLQVTEENFDKLVNGVMERPMFVRLWARYCFHCREFQPVWEQLANDKEFEGRVDVAEIDCEVDRKLCAKYPGTGIPRLFWIDKGSVTGQYQGDKTLPKFQSFVRRMLSLPLILVDSISEIPETNETVQFVLHVPRDDSESVAFVRSIAVKLSSLPCRFYLLLDGVKRARLEVQNGVVFREDLSDQQRVLDFVKAHAVPFMTRLTMPLMRQLEELNVTFMVGLAPADSQTFMKVKDILPVLWVSCDDEPWFCSYIRYNQTSCVIMRSSPRTFWTMKGRVRPESVYSWTQSVRAGKLAGISPKTSPYESIGTHTSWTWVLALPVCATILLLFFRTKQKQD